MSYREHHIVNWGIARNLIGPTGQATAQGQVEKLREEVEEVAVEVDKADRDALKLEIGDVYVVLCQLASMWDLSLDECIDAVWHKIKDRKGIMLQGKFVKEANLEALQRAGFKSFKGRLSKLCSSPDERDAAISAANANGLKPSSQWFSELKAWEVSVS